MIDFIFMNTYKCSSQNQKENGMVREGYLNGVDSKEGNEIEIYVQIKQKRRLNKRRSVKRQEGTLIDKI